MPGGDYRDALRDRAGWTPEPGPLLDVDGTQVGEHRGTAAYTVGQRPGLGVALGEPRYVATIDPVPTSSSSAGGPTSRRRTIELESVSFIAGAAPADPRGRLSGRRSGSAIARPSSRVSCGGSRAAGSPGPPSPVWAAAPGQACVFTTARPVSGVAASPDPIASGPCRRPPSRRPLGRRQPGRMLCRHTAPTRSRRDPAVIGPSIVLASPRRHLLERRLRPRPRVGRRPIAARAPRRHPRRLGR